MARIVLDNVCLTFNVRQHGRTTLKEFLIRQFSRKTASTKLRVKALQNLCLALGDGDRLGILGHNGAGKSTLLKLLAGVYPPTRGTRLVEGRISSLFDIALGFEHDATGWENIFFRGYLQGETPRSMRAKAHAIADFSELDKLLDMPVRYYSAGMVVRLAFSIATAIDPEILLIDEVLSVGDLAFQNKARQRMLEMMAKAKLMVLVSHDLGSLAQICNKAAWMDHGTIRLLGGVDATVEAYTAHVKGLCVPAAAA